MKKANLGKHFGEVPNSKTFSQAYAFLGKNLPRDYETTGNKTPFTAVAAITTKGKHQGAPVIRFFTDGEERARTYECCWGHKTNCNKTHIDCYTMAL